MSLSTPLNQLPNQNSDLNTNMGQQMPPPQQQMPPPQQQMPPPGQQMPPPHQQMPPPQQQMPPQQGEGQIVDDILNELDITDDNGQQDINTDTFNYAMDPSQIPPEKLSGNFLEPQKTNYMENMPNSQPNNNKVGLLGINLNKDTMVNKIIRTVKNPLYVFIILFILSLPQFNRLFFGLFPRFLLENGQIKLLGVLVKALLGAVIFFLCTYLV
jgi:hypothetical protein